MVTLGDDTPLAHVSKLKVGQSVGLKSDEAGHTPMIVVELRGPVKGQVRVTWLDAAGQRRSSYYYEDMLKPRG